MRFLILLAVSLAIALGLGAWSADWALGEAADFGAMEAGPWHANPLAGSVDADPYSKARLARIGNLTLGIGEGVLFRATRDSSGDTLRRECSYVLAGQTPPARVWTLAAFAPNGRLILPGEGRTGWLASRGLMRAEDNSIAIAISPVARPGNWLAVSGRGAYVLALTLYASAFLAEIWRGGVEAIPAGQWDAAASLGLHPLAQLRLIVLPQAFAITRAPIVGFLVQLVKSTALTSIIGFDELMKTSNAINNATFQPFTVYGFVALIYFALCFPLTRYAKLLEQRTATARR